MPLKVNLNNKLFEHTVRSEKKEKIKIKDDLFKVTILFIKNLLKNIKI